MVVIKQGITISNVNTLALDLGQSYISVQSVLGRSRTEPKSEPGDRQVSVRPYLRVPLS